jgi:prepilin-type N-terminal cleavage/methylation domain-containing protein
MKNKIFRKQGFTLIELLLVIGIIATLAIVAFVALDPAKRFQDARNARRVSDVETILTAVHQYIIDNRQSFPASLTEGLEQTLGTGSGCQNYDGGCDSRVDACLDLSTDLAKYLKTIPADPLDGSAENTKYTILRDSNKIVTVRACNAEETTISISR